MIEKRMQGRPKQGGAQVGRARILAGFVDMVRSGNCGDLSRKEIARCVGVTPALITYYFPKGHLLAAEALVPVFDVSLERFKTILANPSRDHSLKLNEAMKFIVEFYMREQHVEILYSELCRKGIIVVSTVDRMKTALSSFLAEEANTADGKKSSSLVANAIWGACQQCALAGCHQDPENHHVTGEVYQLVGRVVALLKLGRRPRALVDAPVITTSTLVRGHC